MPESPEMVEQLDMDFMVSSTGVGLRFTPGFPDCDDQPRQAVLGESSVLILQSAVDEDNGWNSQLTSLDGISSS